MGKYWDRLGIVVSRETKLQSTTAMGSGWLTGILRGWYLFLSMAGSLCMTASALKISADMERILLLLLLCTAAIVAAGFLRSLIRPVTWILLIGYGAGCFFFSGILKEGYPALVNAVQDQLISYYNFSMVRIPGGVEKNAGWLLGAVWGGMILLLGSRVLQKGRISLLILFQLMVTALLIICGISLDGVELLISGGSLLILEGMNCRNGAVQYKIGLLGGILLLGFGVLSWQYAGPAVFARIRPWNTSLVHSVNKMYGNVQELIQNGFPGESCTESGRLNNQSVRQDGETDLTVTLEEKPSENIYLRGFVGDTYEGTYWYEADHTVFEKFFNSEEDSWIIQNLLFLGCEEGGQETVKIHKERSVGDYGYVPYGFEFPEVSARAGDGSYRTTERNLEYQGYGNWKERMGKKTLSAEESETEDAYGAYVREEYLKVPVDHMDRLKEYCSNNQWNTLEEGVNFVVSSMREGYTYSMELEPVPENEDFAEYFFFEQKKGYCIHFATTAVLMLRMSGIPARYVTGYLATASDFVREEEGWTARIPDTQAHAWAEIYLDDVGWIPVEVTPGYGSSNLEPLHQIPVPSAQPEPEDTVPEITPQSTPQSSPEPEKILPENPAQTHVEDEKNHVVYSILLCGGMILGAMLLLLGIAAAGQFRRNIIRSERRRKFRQKNCRKAVKEMCIQMYAMLRDGEVAVTGDDRENVRYLEQTVNASFRKFFLIAQKAAYGRETVTEEERIFCEKFFHLIARYLWNRMGKKKRFWWKYMKCHEIS